jgi:hypothetical protein
MWRTVRVVAREPTACKDTERFRHARETAPGYQILVVRTPSWFLIENSLSWYTARGHVCPVGSGIVERNSFRFERYKRNEFRSTIGQF